MTISTELKYQRYLQKRDELIELEKSIQSSINQSRTVEEYRKLRKKLLKIRGDISEIKTKIKKLRKQYEIPYEYNFKLEI